MWTRYKINKIQPNCGQGITATWQFWDLQERHTRKKHSPLPLFSKVCAAHFTFNTESPIPEVSTSAFWDDFGGSRFVRQRVMPGTVVSTGFSAVWVLQESTSLQRDVKTDFSFCEFPLSGCFCMYFSLMVSHFLTWILVMPTPVVSVEAYG